jgi:hypothetical protein
LLRPKHAKKDYEAISNISVEDIMSSATIAPKKQKLQKESMSYEEIVKIQEKKKKFKKK